MNNLVGSRALFLYATEGIIVTNNLGVISAINPAAERMFGYEHGTLTGKKIEILLPKRYAHKHVDHREGYKNHSNPRSMGIGMDLYGMRKDGSEFPIEISLSPFKDKEEQFVIAFLIDITIRKQQEEYLKKTHLDLQYYAEELKASNAELENFAFISSHDLQEPLRKIQSFGDRLKIMEKEKLSEQGLDYLDRMLNAASRMQNLINDLLTFSRLSSRSKAFEIVDLNQVLKGVLTDLEVTISDNKAHISYTDLPVIEAEAIQIRQLFQNLIANAIKFKKEKVNPEIKIYYKKTSKKSIQNQEMIELYFEDNGIGFNEKYNDRIFNIFQRLEGKAYEGSGIGLAICRKIAIKHGGNIIAKSQAGKGSIFIVSLETKHLKLNQQLSV